MLSCALFLLGCGFVQLRCVCCLVWASLLAHRDSGMAFYDEYLRSAAWREKRELTLARDGWRCVLCNSAENLQVHHRTYATAWL